MSVSPTPESVTLDELDKRIVRCLQLRPRGAFSLVAQVLDVSEQTVARRYRRLHKQGVIRVLAAVNPRALGQSDWIVRLRCRPDGTLDLGRALARRDDIAWVSVSAGGSELVCAVRSHTAEDRDRLLLDRLPRTTAVVDLSASVQLRRFAGGGASDWAGLGNALDATEVYALGADRARADPAPTGVTLDTGDYAMLEVLAHDGRASYSTLARAARSTEGRVARRLTALLDTGVVYLDVDLAGGALGYPISAYVWMTVPPAALHRAGEAIATHDETPFVAAISGPTNLVASVTCRDIDHLYGYVTERVGAVEGIAGIEISPVLRRLKQAGTLVDGDRLATR